MRKNVAGPELLDQAIERTFNEIRDPAAIWKLTIWQSREMHMDGQDRLREQAQRRLDVLLRLREK